MKKELQTNGKNTSESIQQPTNQPTNRTKPTRSNQTTNERTHEPTCCAGTSCASASCARQHPSVLHLHTQRLRKNTLLVHKLSAPLFSSHFHPNNFLVHSPSYFPRQRRTRVDGHRRYFVGACTHARCTHTHARAVDHATGFVASGGVDCRCDDVRCC